jgi:hypothetical protein
VWSAWIPYLKSWLIRKKRGVVSTFLFLVLLGALKNIENAYQVIFRNEDVLKEIKFQMVEINRNFDKLHASQNHYIDHNDSLWAIQHSLDQELIGKVNYTLGKIEANHKCKP